MRAIDGNTAVKQIKSKLEFNRIGSHRNDITLLVLGCSTCSCSFTASSMAFNCWTHLFAISSISSTSDVSSVQYLQRIFASSPTLTERVIMHNEMNDTTNNTAGIPKKNRKLFHVVSKSKRASTFAESTCKFERNLECYCNCFETSEIHMEMYFEFLCGSRCACKSHEKLITSDLNARSIHFSHLIVETCITWLSRIIGTIASMWM